MTSISELTYIYLAFILPDEEVMVTEDKINALIKVAGVSVEPFWPGLFAKRLASANIGSLLCNVVAGEFVPEVVLPQQEVLSSPPAAPAEESNVEGKKEESEESDDDIGFGLFD